eukprot:SAG11_NODE_2037_length_3894_cov_3.210277_1_plen_638_part_10
MSRPLWIAGCSMVFRRIGCSCNEFLLFRATPLHNMLPFLAMYDRGMACRLLNDTIASFRSHGINEWVGPYWPAAAAGSPGYVASAASALFASEKLRCWEQADRDLPLKSDDDFQKADQAARTAPPMGYSLWKAFHFEGSEDDVKKAADGLVSSGMRAAGYRTLSLDGGWWGGGKSGKVRRNASGFFTVNETKFPSSGKTGNGGLRKLSDYVTSRGFEFGLYSSAGMSMCSKDTGGGAGHEQKDAALFVSWNISLMKLDDCGSSRAEAQSVMTKWRALYDKLSPHRKIMLFNSQVGCCNNPSGACSAQYANALPQWCYDTSTTMYQPNDGDDGWATIMLRHKSVHGRSHLAKPGSWLDPGFLTLDVGDNYYNGSDLQLKLDQNRAVFSLWAIVSAPLVASVSFSGRICPAGSFGQPSYGEQCILSRNVPQTIVDVLVNKDAIDINQNFDRSHWHAGDLVADAQLPGSVQLFAKPLPDGATGCVLFSEVGSPSFDFSLQILPTFGRGGLACPAGGCRVLDVWSNSTMVVAADANTTYALRRRQALLLRVETKSFGSPAQLKMDEAVTQRPSSAPYPSEFPTLLTRLGRANLSDNTPSQRILTDDLMVAAAAGSTAPATVSRTASSLSLLLKLHFLTPHNT